MPNRPVEIGTYKSKPTQVCFILVALVFVTIMVPSLDAGTESIDMNTGALFEISSSSLFTLFAFF